jgi:hypothetical protein
LLSYSKPDYIAEYVGYKEAEIWPSTLPSSLWREQRRKDPTPVKYRKPFICLGTEISYGLRMGLPVVIPVQRAGSF